MALEASESWPPTSGNLGRWTTGHLRETLREATMESFLPAWASCAEMVQVGKTRGDPRLSKCPCWLLSRSWSDTNLEQNPGGVTTGPHSTIKQTIASLTGCLGHTIMHCIRVQVKDDSSFLQLLSPQSCSAFLMPSLNSMGRIRKCLFRK